MSDAGPGPGHDHGRCGAESRTGGTCGLPAGWGTDHVGVGRCRKHGGNTKSHRAAAASEMAGRALRRLGQPIDGAQPQEQLLAMVCEAAGNVATLRDLVSELAVPGDMPDTVDEGLERPLGRLWGARFHASGMPTGEALEHVLVGMYRDWADRLVKYSSEAIRCGIAERQVELAEAQAGLVARVIMGLLDDPELGLAATQRAIGRRIAGRHLRSLGTAT